MRDPDGTLAFHPDHVARSVRGRSPAVDFLRTGAAQALVRKNRLVPYEFAPDGTIVSPRLPFVSYPHEWSDAQLLEAARLTLAVAREALAAGHELKDASAWNVIYRGAHPIFCDHLSFRPIEQREWWAFGQFVRHFILPLGVAKLRGFHAYRCFQIGRDGLDQRTARALMGGRRFLSRYWPLVIESGSGAGEPRRRPAQDAERFRTHIYRYCERSLPKRAGDPRSVWSRYVDERPHYTPAAHGFKRETVERWLGASQPAWVVDLGCNTGEFSLLAARSGAPVVVAIDSDHDAVQALFAHGTGSVVHPVVADLADLSGGRGWMGDETPGLLGRLAGRADMVICLAVVHHLAITESIPLTEIARLIARLSRALAIVELIDPPDPMVAVLATQRQRDPADFGIERQRDALAEFFDIEAEAAIPDTKRTLVLLRLRRPSSEGAGARARQP